MCPKTYCYGLKLTGLTPSNKALLYMYDGTLSCLEESRDNSQKYPNTSGLRLQQPCRENQRL